MRQQVARSVASLPGGSLLVGKSAISCAWPARWDGPHAVGAIRSLARPVRLSELAAGQTARLHAANLAPQDCALLRALGLTDHCVVPATHLGLVFSDEAANQAVAFLRTERFTRTA